MLLLLTAVALVTPAQASEPNDTYYVWVDIRVFDAAAQPLPENPRDWEGLPGVELIFYLYDDMQLPPLTLRTNQRGLSTVLLREPLPNFPDLNGLPDMYVRISQAEGWHFSGEKHPPTNIRVEGHEVIIDFHFFLDSIESPPIPRPENGIYINGQRLTLDVPPTMVNNRMLVPIRHIGEVFDAEFEWDRATQTATMTLGDTIVIMEIGNLEARVIVGGVESIHVLDAPPTIRDNRTLVPLRFIGEVFGADVQWQSPNAIITTTP